MNKTLKTLEVLTEYEIALAKDKKRSQKEIVLLARKLFLKGLIPGIDLGLIAHANGQKAF